MTATLSHLTPVNPDRIAPTGIGCVALTHNEMAILPQFIDHYRRLGVTSFAIVDDRSDDGSSDWLAAQPDIAVFHPVAGSTYAEHKRQWRAELLDRYFADRWVFAPDIDEHFVYPGWEDDAPGAFVDRLQEAGAQAVFAMMIDMYRDAPISDHVYTGDVPLAQAFPLFDGNTGLNYRLLPAPRSFRVRYPTPQVYASGGMRERVFLPAFQTPTALQARLLRRWGHLNRPLMPGPVDRMRNAFLRRVVKDQLPANPLDITKIVLVKWHAGSTYSGGTHALNLPLRLHPHPAVLLHYKFTAGRKGIEYTANRGQHDGGGKYYKAMLTNVGGIDESPVFGATQRMTDSRALFDGLRVEWPRALG